MKMSENQKAMWEAVADAIEPFCVNGGGIIRDYLCMNNLESSESEGFKLWNEIDHDEDGMEYEVLRIMPSNYHADSSGYTFPIEEDIRLIQDKVFKDRDGNYCQEDK